MVYEIIYRLKGAAHWAWTLTGWMLRPMAAWSMLSVVYQLNSTQDMSSVENAPDFTSWIFPFFATPWTRGETWQQVIIRLISTPTVWVWGSVVVVLAGLIWLFIRRVLSDHPLPLWKIISMLVGLYILAGILHLSVASLPNGAWSTSERKGSLLSCWHAHVTMLYAVPFVKTKGHFLRNFKEIQPKLKFTIHALSHPPGGTLSMYYIGKITGAGGMNIRLDSTRIRYAFGLTFFAAINVFILFAMGRGMFGDSKHGFTASLLWIVAPSVIAYATFAQDGLYSVFFNLALLLIWRICTKECTPYVAIVALGLVFSCLVFLTYSWCLVTMIFALFIVYCTWRNKWSFYTLVLRGGVPLGVMTVISGWIILHYKLDYLGFYKVSSEYVRRWYLYGIPYHHIIAWIGGQIEWLLMMGIVTCSAFIASLHMNMESSERHSQLVFLGIILIVYILPVLFGPTCLRLETARCWMWVMSVPVCFAADYLLNQSHPRIFVTGAVMISLGTYTLVRLFLNFA